MREGLALWSAAVGLLAAATPVSAESAAVNYMLHCRGCHLADGAGSPGKVPALKDSVGLFLTIPGGREYLVRVPGSAQAPISDAELAELLNWLLERFGPVSADFEPFTRAEVAALRHPPLTEVERVREELMRRIRDRR